MAPEAVAEPDSRRSARVVGQFDCNRRLARLDGGFVDARKRAILEA